MIENTRAAQTDPRPGETLVVLDPGLRIVLRGVGAQILTGLGGGAEAGSSVEARPPASMLVIKHRRGQTPPVVGTIYIGSRTNPHVIHVALDPEVPTAPAALPEGSAADLTPRQREVLALLAQGVRATGIAALLGVSATTVRNHIRGALARLGCHSQLEAVAEARRRGLLDA